MYYKYRYLLLLLGGIIIFSCSTKKNTTTTRFYHNLTTHYNVYFNGVESYKKGLKSAENSIENDYTQILPIFLYSDKNVSQRVYSDMDRAIQKVTKAINLHSITAKPEMKKGQLTEKDKEFYERMEYNKWIDECYLLMGKSYLYRQEYGLAKDAFKYIINKYDYEPTIYNAQIWLLRCHNEKNEFRESEMIINLLKSDLEFPKDKLQGELDISIADYHMKQKEYQNAIPYLEKALEKTRDKYYKIRFTYILAQLYQETNNPVKAFDTYGKVIKMNPPYAMTFNAKINQAGVFNTNTGNTREMKAQLYKMLKDDKNIEYRDQIYYALGNIAYKEGNLEEAIKNYQTSIRESMGNNNQISLSYKTIADIYYQQPQYEKAQAYYDSTLAFLSQDHQEYNIIFDRAKLLNKLVDYNNTIIVQDSLLRIAKMDEKERLALIDKAISDVIYQEQLIREKAAREQQEQSYNRSILNENNYRGTSNTNTGGKWYFYNPGGKGFGQAEFKMKWGTRELEDNWRRKNKKSMASSVELLADSEEEDTMDPKKGLDSKSREYYLLDIPMSDSAQEKSHLKIQKAYYNKALLYRNDLNESDLALEAFKELTRKYPESEFAVSSYYNIYQIYQVKGDKEKENIYKNIIINNYPNSNYAKLLTDPTYIKKLEEKEKEVLNFYMATYEKYKNKMYHDVIKDTDYAIAKFSKNPLIPKFMYLKALSVGYLYDDDVLFKQNLDELIAKYPNDDVSQQAMETIEYLANTSQEVIKEIEKQEEIIAKEIYSYNPDTIHYFAFSVKRSTDVDQLTFNIINYNIDHYEESNLSSSGEELFGEYNIVYVKGFKTALEAQNYMKKLIVNNTIYRDVEKENLEPFVISPLNLITLKEDKQLDRYFKFYKAFYKK